jgi:hypothetical protein
LSSSYFFSYLSTYIWNQFLTKLVTKVKPNINSVEVHLQLSNNWQPVDGVLVGAGSLWPANSIDDELFMSMIAIQKDKPKADKVHKIADPLHYAILSLHKLGSTFSRCLRCTRFWIPLTERASPAVVTMWKKFTSKFSYLLFFSNPTHQTRTWTANRWETTNSKPPGQIIMIDQSEIESDSQIISITLFSDKAGVSLWCPQLTGLSKVCRTKIFWLSQAHVFWLFFIQF